MNAPYFDMKNLPSPWGSVAWMYEIIAEEKRCCEEIDIRLHTLQSEFRDLTAKLSILETQLANNTSGVFAGFSLLFKIRKIAKEMRWRRRAIIKLFDARIARTFGP
jgi:hypothetical protein